MKWIIIYRWTHKCKYPAECSVGVSWCEIVHWVDNQIITFGDLEYPVSKCGAEKRSEKCDPQTGRYIYFHLQRVRVNSSITFVQARGGVSSPDRLFPIKCLATKRVEQYRRQLCFYHKLRRLFLHPCLLLWTNFSIPLWYFMPSAL